MMTKRFRLTVRVGLLSLLLVGATAHPAVAEIGPVGSGEEEATPVTPPSLVVTSTLPEGAGSLHWAIAGAEDGATITFDLPAGSVVELPDEGLVLAGQ